MITKFQELQSIQNKWGSLKILTYNNLYLIEAKGFITPELIKKNLLAAQEFGLKNSSWKYIIDTRNVSMIHPLNIFELRNIPKLPNLEKHYVLTNNRIFRILGKSFLSKALPVEFIENLDSF